MRDLKRAQVSEPPSRWLRLRVQLIGVVFLLLLAGAWGRAIKLQVFERQKLAELARDQYIRHIDISGRRGEIDDRRGTALGRSTEVDSIWIDPSLLPDVTVAAKGLAGILKLETADLIQRFGKTKRFVWVKRHVTPAEVRQVKALGLPGLGFSKEPKRFYPQRELAAHVLGLVGTDGRGLEGVELAFDDELSGQDSKLSGLRDARGRKLLTQGPSNPLDGQGARMTLTLDGTIQYHAEKALSRAVREAQAPAGMIVVLDPRTGELLAVANHPTFNPNTPRLAGHGHTKNRAALDTFEPGSTFKAFVAAAALEEKVIRRGDALFCENGAWKVGRHTINDTHPHGWLDLEGVLRVSSNICTAKIAELLGRQRLVDYYRAFGFGERSGLGLPGEGKGVIPFPKADVSLATQSFGQGLTATAVQIAAAFGALANGGVLMRPYLVQKIVDADGVVLLENRPTEVRRVVSEPTARRVIEMLESVVGKDGTAPKARMDEYRVAGKTGTAQKADPVARGYSDKRLASFVGVVPAESPRLVILVVIDEPKKDVYGGIVAAPAFKEIAAAAMPYLGVPPSNPGTLVAQASVAAPVKAPPPAVTEAVVEEVEESVGEGRVRVPALTGEVGRAAVAKLLSASLRPQLVGSGRVVSQEPPAGTAVEKGAKVMLELSSRP